MAGRPLPCGGHRGGWWDRAGYASARKSQLYNQKASLESTLMGGDRASTGDVSQNRQGRWLECYTPSIIGDRFDPSKHGCYACCGGCSSRAGRVALAVLKRLCGRKLLVVVVASSPFCEQRLRLPLDTLAGLAAFGRGLADEG
jgi:hypothetical protein